MATDILPSYFGSNLNKLFTSLDEEEEHLNIVLNKVDDKYQLDITKINNYGNTSKKELFSNITQKENKKFLNFGYGIQFELNNEDLILKGTISNQCEYFETNINLILSGLNINHKIWVKANEIVVQDDLLSNNNLILKGNKLVNEGLIYSHFLNLNFNEIENKGNIIVKKNLTINTNILKNKDEAIISSNELSNIAVENLIINEDSTISAKTLKINTSKMDLVGKAMIKSKNFKFFGDELIMNESTCLEVIEKSKIRSTIFKNYSNDVKLGEETDLLTNVFLNVGTIQAKEVRIVVDSEKIMYNRKQLRKLFTNYSCDSFGDFMNLGELLGEKLIVETEGHFYNKKLIKAKKLFKLCSEEKFINMGEIYQEENNNLKSSIYSGTRIINKNGRIELANDLSINSGISIDNTEGKIKSRNIKMYISINEDGEYIKNEAERLASQTEKNNHSEEVKKYQKIQRMVDGFKDQEEVNTGKDESDNSHDDNDNENKSDILPEKGYFVNTQGKLIATKDIAIKGSGAIYNADKGEICSRNKINIKIYGRVLNQLESKILTRELEVLSSSKFFNTGGSRIEGNIQCKCVGFENGIGSVIKIMNFEKKNISTINSQTAIFNFGKIVSPEKSVKLLSNTKLINYGFILSKDTIKINVLKEISNYGKISGNEIDLSEVSGLYNKQGGEVEARGRDIIFKKGVILSNEGRIVSNNLKLDDLQLNKLCSQSENVAIIDVKNTLIVNCDYPLFNINGIWKANKLILNNNVYDEINISELLKGTENKLIIKEEATFNFSNAEVINDKNTVLNYNTKIIANNFFNLSLLHCKYNLSIQSKTDIINDEDNSYAFVFRLTNDWDIDNNPNLNKPLEGFEIDLAKVNKKCNGIISSEGDMALSAGKVIKNIGIIKTNKHLKIKADCVGHGWAKESLRYESLPGLPNFSYEYMDSQPSYIKAENGADVEANIFLNTLGRISINGGLTSKNRNIFLNYAGKIEVHGNARIVSPTFANLVGTQKTNRSDKRYWSLEFCNTDVAIFNVLRGKFRLENSNYVINSGSAIYASGGVFLNGSKNNNLYSISEINILSSGFRYTRMYSINEYNYGEYKDRILGMSMASLGNGAIIRAELNETVQKRVLPASISSSKQVIIKDYVNIKSNGIIHAENIFIKTGNGLTELGYTGDAILPSLSSMPKKIELFPYVNELASEGVFDIAEEGDFMFKSKGGDLKIPFTLIEDKSKDVKNVKLPFSLEILETMMLRQIQKVLGTGYISDMPSFLDAAEVAYSMSNRKENFNNYSFLKEYTNCDIALISDSDAKKGLFFVPKSFGKYTLLFPELRLSVESVHIALKNPAGATVAQGKSNSNVIIDTEGFLHATALIHADDNIKIKAGRGALFETTTYDEMAITQKMEVRSSRKFCGIGGGKKYYKLTRWENIKKAREPMLATTTRGDFIIILPNNKETIEFKGIFTNVGGDTKLYNGKVKLSPLEVANVVKCPEIIEGGANRISTIIPVFLKTILTSSHDFLTNVQVFENNGGVIEALGDVIINASEEIDFKTESRIFTLAEGKKVSESFFTSKEASRKVEDVIFNQPSMKAGGNIKFNANKVHLTGNYEAEENIEIKANIAKLESTLAYGTDEFHSNASSMFSEASYDRYATFARICPTVFRSHGDFIVDIVEEYAEHSINKVCRDEKIKAGSIDSTPLTVRETVREYSSSFGFDFFIPTSVVAPVCDGNIKDAIDTFWKQSSLVNVTNSLLHSSKGAEIAANGIATALSAYSSISTVLEYGIEGFASLFGVGNIGFYATEMERNTKHMFTVGSMTVAGGNIDWLATKGDIKITHHVAIADGNQSYTAAGRIEVKPGEEITETDQEIISGNGSFNILTYDFGFGINGSDGHSKTTNYQASKFKTKGENIFRAGKDIYIVIPQIDGKRNTFDAVLVNLENKANEVKTENNSYGVTFSTNIKKAVAGTVGGNIGMGNSHDTYLNEAYIKGATSFEHSKVNNKGCLVMDIDNKGASYQYIPIEEVHESENFAIAFSGLDISSADAFAYSLGKNIASSAASMGVGMLASEAGLGGFVSTMASTLAGTYVNTELMSNQKMNIKSNESNNQKLPSIGINSRVSYDRNGNGFQAQNLDFNKQAVCQLIKEIKEKYFNEALDQNLPVKDVGEKGQKIDEQVKELMENEKVKEVIQQLKMINKEIKKQKENPNAPEEKTTNELQNKNGKTISREDSGVNIEDTDINNSNSIEDFLKGTSDNEESTTLKENINDAFFKSISKPNTEASTSNSNSKSSLNSEEKKLRSIEEKFKIFLKECAIPCYEIIKSINKKYQDENDFNSRWDKKINDVLECIGDSATAIEIRSLVTKNKTLMPLKLIKFGLNLVLDGIIDNVLEIGREKAKEFLLNYTDNEREAQAVNGMVDDAFNIFSVAKTAKGTLSSVKRAHKSLKISNTKSKSLKLSHANSNTKPSLKNNSEMSSSSSFVNDNSKSSNTTHYKAVNDNSKNAKRTHYKAVNDNGEKGNLIFLDHPPESKSKKLSVEAFLKESSSSKPVNSNNPKIRNKIITTSDVPQFLPEILIKNKLINNMIQNSESENNSTDINIMQPNNFLTDFDKNSEYIHPEIVNNYYFEGTSDVKGKKPCVDEKNDYNTSRNSKEFNEFQKKALEEYEKNYWLENFKKHFSETTGIPYDKKAIEKILNEYPLNQGYPKPKFRKLHGSFSCSAVPSWGKDKSPWYKLTKLPVIFRTGGNYVPQEVTISYELISGEKAKVATPLDLLNLPAPVTGIIRYVNDKNEVIEKEFVDSITINRSTSHLADVQVKFYTQKCITPTIINVTY